MSAENLQRNLHKLTRIWVGFEPCDNDLIRLTAGMKVGGMTMERAGWQQSLPLREDDFDRFFDMAKAELKKSLEKEFVR